jgi:hypothetical protein
LDDWIPNFLFEKGKREKKGKKGKKREKKGKKGSVPVESWVE